MKKVFIATAILLLSYLVNAQHNENITIGKKEVIYSKALVENRTVWIYTPDMTAGTVTPGKKYPVLYLLDGDAHFFSTAGIIQQLSQANGNGVIPEMIVVGIENTNRFRDLVPAKDVTKANAFSNFLSAELIPHLDKHYQTAPYRVLAGHSLGGLTVVDMLVTSPGLFNAYIAIDPSMWFDNEWFLNNIITRLPKQKMKGERLFIGIANTMPAGMTMTGLKKDKSGETVHIRSILKLGTFLNANTNGLQYSQQYYEKERHNTVPLLSIYDGLRFIFDYYFFDAGEKDFADTTAAIAKRLQSHYANVSAKMGYKNAAPETLINYLAYDALEKKQYTKANALFKLNLEWYPANSSVYEAYAGYFLTRKDTVSAIANYKKAIQLEPNGMARQKMEILTTQSVAVPVTVNLNKYAGVYILATYNIPIILEIRNGQLWAKMQGEEDDELLWLAENVFTVKGKQDYKITFQMNGDKPAGFTSVQPNGTFKAIFSDKQPE